MFNNNNNWKLNCPFWILTKAGEDEQVRQGSISPVMRFLISLFSSLFLHSNKPVTIAGFRRDGQGVVSALRADGRTGKEKTWFKHRYKYFILKAHSKTKWNLSVTLWQKWFPSQSEQILPCVSSRLSDTVFLSSFSSLLSRTHSCSLASSSSCKSFTHKYTLTFKFTFPSCCQPNWPLEKTEPELKRWKMRGKVGFGKKGA